MTSSYPWPPISFSSGNAVVNSAQMSLLPQYTPTGTPITMPAPTVTQPGQAGATINAGNVWTNPANSRAAYVPIARYISALYY